MNYSQSILRLFESNGDHQNIEKFGMNYSQQMNYDELTFKYGYSFTFVSKVGKIIEFSFKLHV